MNAAKLLAKNFSQEHPSDAALILEGMTLDAAARFIEELPPRCAARLLQTIVPLSAAHCCARLAPEYFEQVISLLPLDHAAGLLRRLEPEQQQRLLTQAPSHVATLLRRVLRYPETCAGALMDPLIMALPQDISVSEALARVRQSPHRALYYLYVVDREQRLVGVLNLRELMLAPPKNNLGAVMHREVSSLTAFSERTAITDHPGWRNVHALPVVDDQRIFLGVLRYETLRRLESASKPPTAGGDALSAVLTWGELCWVGLAGVLTDLTTSMEGLRTVSRHDEGPTNG